MAWKLNVPYHQSLLCTALNHNLWTPHHIGFWGWTAEIQWIFYGKIKAHWCHNCHLNHNQNNDATNLHESCDGSSRHDHKCEICFNLLDNVLQQLRNYKILIFCPNFFDLRKALDQKKPEMLFYVISLF